MPPFATRPATTPLVDLLDLSGRTAVVTGAAMGIGEAIATRLHEAGAAVVVADVDVANAMTVAAQLEDRRADSAMAVACDVGDAEAVEAAMAAAVDRFGSVDILVNNAGIYPFATLPELDAATFDRVVRTNLVGTFLCMKAAAARMIEQGRGGRIVNITSIDALHPSMVGLAHYDATKHGVWGMTKNLALELAEHAIVVNALAPGGVATPGTGGAVPDEFVASIPMGRIGDPDDIARAVVFLASDLASYITGAQVVVDGGVLLR